MALCKKGATVAQIAIAWVLARGEDIVPLIGARRSVRLSEVLGALSVTLSADDLAHIEQAVPAGAAYWRKAEEEVCYEHPGIHDQPCSKHP